MSNRLYEFHMDFSLGKPECAKEYNSLRYKISEDWNITALQNYLSTAYVIVNDHARGEDINIFSKGGYRIFNTGLEKNLHAIYCVGKEKQKDSGKFNFKGFFTEKEIKETLEIENCDFSKLQPPKEILKRELINSPAPQDIIPPSKNFIKDDAKKRLRWICENCCLESISNNRCRIIDPIDKGEAAPRFYDWMHLIIDNCNRLPLTLLKETIYEGLYENYNNKYQIQCDILANWINQKRNTHEVIKQILEKAIKYSENIHKIHNYMIVPFYYIEKSCLNYALPLYLEYKEKPDCAVIFNAKGEIHTILHIDQIRLNARIIGLDVHRFKWLS